jgi:hypothetical protein
MTEDATAPPMYCAVCNQPYPGPHRPTCSAAPAPVEVDVERLRERLKREAARRNSAYDHYGYGWTPEKVDPEVWAAAAEITALRERVADAENQCGYFRVRFNEQITRAEAAEADATRWRWMRDHWTRMTCLKGRDEPKLLMENERWADWTEDAIVAAIDAAMSERK